MENYNITISSLISLSKQVVTVGNRTLVGIVVDRVVLYKKIENTVKN